MKVMISQPMKGLKEEHIKNKDKNTYEHKCRQCGRAYDELDSDAEKKEYFCCIACEFGY